MEPLARVEGIPEVWTKVTDTAERSVLVQFPYPIHRPHLACFPKYGGSEFVAARVRIKWTKFGDDPWRLRQVVADGRAIKHNGRISGNETREAAYDESNLDQAPPLLRALVAQNAPS
jgi:hypothetical protein